MTPTIVKAGKMAPVRFRISRPDDMRCSSAAGLAGMTTTVRASVTLNPHPLHPESVVYSARTTPGPRANGSDAMVGVGPQTRGDPLVLTSPAQRDVPTPRVKLKGGMGFSPTSPVAIRATNWTSLGVSESSMPRPSLEACRVAQSEPLESSNPKPTGTEPMTKSSSPFNSKNRTTTEFPESNPNVWIRTQTV